MGVRSIRTRMRAGFAAVIALSAVTGGFALVAAGGSSSTLVMGTLIGLMVLDLSLTTWVLSSVWRSLRSPLRELERAAEEFRSANLDHRIDIEGPEEFIDFAEAFNALAEHSERMRVQAVHTQRVKAIGQLAAGVAHDFNNLLTAVLASAELLRAQTSDAEALEDIETITEAGQRGAQLVEQLLIYARKDVVSETPVDISQLTREMDRLLQPIVGESVELMLELSPGLPAVEADPGQLGQVLMNLVLNARDAMEGSGRLTIRTFLAMEGPGETSEAGGGPYVALEVSDTGRGISDEIRDQIFEPFFTTKSRSEGTGLGLSTVQSIVDRFRGHLKVASTIGEGATFTAYFPALPTGLEEEVAVVEAEKPTTSTDRSFTILVVEDDRTVLQSIARTLASAGHRVLTARSASEALVVLTSIYGDVDLMLTDVVMPGESGPELAEELYQRWSELPVLYMTGYGTEVLKRHKLANDARVLFKPFEKEELLAAINVTARADHIAPRVRDRMRLE